MSKIIDRVHTDQETINHLKQLQLELDAELEVELHLRDGRVIRGTLPERPIVMQFQDPQGNEGTNGLIRLDLGDGQVHLMLLDEVDHFERIGSVPDRTFEEQSRGPA